MKSARAMLCRRYVPESSISHRGATPPFKGKENVLSRLVIQASTKNEAKYVYVSGYHTTVETKTKLLRKTISVKIINFM